MRPGDLVRLTGVARLYSAIDAAAQNAVDDDVFGILLRERTSEYSEEDVESLGFGSRVWDVLVKGSLEKIWEIDLYLINSIKNDDIVLGSDIGYNEENFSHLRRVMRIVKDERF